ncbi:peptidoglycan DD-metalloendopeptidase family protein [Priestia sp. SB1]|uniref:peptidoglycan DD-metalloendopeptidase family protein n=1 Tax=Priestia sp. SB1 TaxID=3132359 RepID=UPI00317EA325
MKNVYALGSGKVVGVNNNEIVIKDVNGNTMNYKNLKQVNLNEGQYVESDQLVGEF